MSLYFFRLIRWLGHAWMAVSWGTFSLKCNPNQCVRPARVDTVMPSQGNLAHSKAGTQIPICMGNVLHLALIVSWFLGHNEPGWGALRIVDSPLLLKKQLSYLCAHVVFLLIIPLFLLLLFSSSFFLSLGPFQSLSHFLQPPLIFPANTKTYIWNLMKHDANLISTKNHWNVLFCLFTRFTHLIPMTCVYMCIWVDGCEINV